MGGWQGRDDLPGSSAKTPRVYLSGPDRRGAISARRRDERAEHRDDRGVVALAPAARDAGDEELTVQRGGEQRRARRVPDLEHQLDVLEMLGELALGLEPIGEHALALDVHRARVGRPVLQHREQIGPVEPWRSPNSNPSASASRLRPSTRLTTSFARAPAPWPPTWCARRAMASKIGRQRSKTGRSPPTTTGASRRRACPLDPATGASSIAIPRRASSPASAAEASGWIVLQSTTISPGPAASSAPSGPSRASRTMSAVMRQVSTIAAPRAASAGEPAATPPRATCSRTRRGATS